MNDYPPNASPEITLSSEYQGLLGAIKREITTSRIRAVLAANSELIHQYWRIGRHILDRQLDEGWGKKVIPRLAADLRTEFPEAKGYSRTNLHRMRAFAAAWPEFVPQAVGQIPWGHIVIIIEMINDQPVREFYARKTVEQGWTRGVLTTMIKGGLHLRIDHPLHNFDRTVPPEDRESVQGLVKDPYVLDFLDPHARHEREIEKQIVENIVRFLQELGVGFAFVGRQYQLVVGGEEFFIDLLFYHLRLRRYVIIELKTKGFAPEHLGKLSFYVTAVDEVVRDPEHDQPSVGILLVANRNKVVVEFSLRGISSPVAIGTHTDLPAEVRAALPSAEELARAIEPALREDCGEETDPDDPMDPAEDLWEGERM